MLEEELELAEATAEFVQSQSISADGLREFLVEWAGHPDHYVDFTKQVATNLATLNVALLNELSVDKRLHLVKALILTVKIAFDMKVWEYMLGRKDAAWYWDKHGLFFSSLHSLIPQLNDLQKHISELEHAYSFTGRLVYLEGDSERAFLERLHLETRTIQLDNQYFVYGGTGALRENLRFHIRDKNEKGVRVDLAYDGDSNFGNQIVKLQRQVKIHRVFRFDRDFESAFPPEMLARAIAAYLRHFKEAVIDISREDVEAMLKESKPFVKVVEENYEVSITKPFLGELLAIELLKLSRRDHRVLNGTGSIVGTELSRFLRFIMDWPEEISAEENTSDDDIAFDLPENGVKGE